MRVDLTTFIAAIVVVAVLGYWLGTKDGYDEGVLELQASWDKAEKQRALDYTRLVEQRKKERELEIQRYQAKEAEYETNLLAASRRADELAQRLRNRPERTSAPVPGALAASPTPACCTGAQLCREDGEFLVREAARADALRAAVIRTQE